MRFRPLPLALATALVLPLGLSQAVAAPTPDPVETSTPPSSITGEVQRLAIDDFERGAFDITVIVPEDGTPVRVKDAALADVPTGAVVTADLGTVTAASQEADQPNLGAAVTSLDVVAESAADSEVAAGSPAVAGAIPLGGRVRDVFLATGIISGQARDGITSTSLKTDITENVGPFWSDSTNGQVKLGVTGGRNNLTYTGWGNTGTCSTEQVLGILAWTSRLAGYSDVAGHGDHAVIYTPTLSSCWFGGVAHIADGGSLWLNGDTNRATRSIVFAHEFGHNLTLGHSQSRVVCANGRADGTTTQCSDGEYGDAYDIMGTASAVGLLGAAHFDTLGLLKSTNSVTVTSSRDITLKPVGGLAGVRFAKFTSGGATYYVEYRGAVGRDADLGSSRWGCPYGVADCSTASAYTPGVIVRRVDQRGFGAEGFLLDAGVGDPAYTGSEPWFTLPVNRTFLTSNSGVAVKTLSTSSTGATVRISIPGIPRPTVTATGATKWGSRYYTRSSTAGLSWTVDPSVSVTSQQILRNGTRMMTLPAGQRSVDLGLIKGVNNFQVRLVTAQGTTTSLTTPVVYDLVVPTFPKAPSLGLRTGQIVGTELPATLSWKAADAMALKNVTLLNPERAMSASTTSTWVSAPYGKKIWTLRAQDVAGNTRNATVTKTSSFKPETTVTNSGRWTKVTSSYLFGGQALKASAKGASTSTTFTGSSVTWIATKSATSGKASVYIDGKLARTVDLYSATTKYKQAVFAQNFASVGTHTIKVVVQGTSGRPGVMSDGFAVLR